MSLVETLSTPTKEPLLPQTEKISRVRRRPTIDALVSQGQGKSLREMGEMEDKQITGEAVRKYLKKTDQYDLWKKSRVDNYEINKKKKKLELMGVIIRRAIALAYEQSWVQGKTEESMYVTPPSQEDSREKRIKLFERYQYAARCGERPSFEKLGAYAGISAMTAKRLLNKVGLKSLYWTFGFQPRLHIPTILFTQLATLGFPGADIAYFCGVRASLVKSRIKIEEYRSFRRTLPGGLTFALAHKFYKENALGYAYQEIALLYSKPLRNVTRAFENKAEIEPVILKASSLVSQYHPLQAATPFS